MKKCNALINENYNYQYAGDCAKSCICSVTNKQCTAIDVDDPEGKSYQFFNMMQATFNENKAKKCPLYGVSEKLLKELLIEKTK